MPRIICPYCLDVQSFSKTLVCAKCQAQVPDKYIENSRKANPVWLVTFGFPQHGKTSFINSLTVDIENLNKIARDSDYSFLDDFTRLQIREIRKGAKESVVRIASTNAKAKPQPLLIAINDFLDRPSNTLVIYDMPGEVVADPTLSPETANAIKNAETVWFFVSLTDLADDTLGYSILDLFDVYQQAMKSMNVSIKDRNILVIYTKVDRMYSSPDKFPLSDRIMAYLENDPYNRLKASSSKKLKQLNKADCVSELNEISEALEEFTSDYVEGGGSFISRIHKSGAKLSFSIISAIGEENTTGETSAGTEVQHIRVLDPLIWALTQRRDGRNDRSVSLLMDVSAESGPIYASGWPGQFYDALTSSNLSVLSYYMGTVTPAFDTGQSPTGKNQPDSALRLIGPILDRAEENSLAVAIISSNMIDLNDYMYSTWDERLLVVTLSKELADLWPNRIVLKPDSDPYDIVRTFLERFQ
jgi:hypothetical protein